MQTVALTLVLALAAPAEATPAATPEDGAPEATTPAATAPSAQRVWGVGLLAGGCALLAVTATGAALVDAVTRPDDRDDERAYPEVLQAITFASMLLGAASLGAMVAGGALVVTE
ncbi:MAG: hypothetical protein HYS27_17755 [Deltaproteobacteria bacterium]|nr:hypothetical protein [Deltaproteobacteria bacterium]